MKRLPIFDELAALYAKNGFNLYMVGGTSRDLLLSMPLEDLDFCTDATVEEERTFLPEGSDYSFARYGRVKLGKSQGRAEITTLREEGEYLDHRHPSFIKFVKDLASDSRRRDFTINAIYIDSAMSIHDFHGGLDDLRSKTIRTIGDPYIRFREDPLRICRAERFSLRLGFEIEERTLEALKACYPLLGEINPAKLEEEKRKGWIWRK